MESVIRLPKILTSDDITSTREQLSNHSFSSTTKMASSTSPKLLQYNIIPGNFRELNILNLVKKVSVTLYLQLVWGFLLLNKN